jgi:hypothetical protein
MDRVDLRQLVEPLFVEHGVDVVFAGHEHFYERMKPQKGIYYFTEGGSAKLREGNIRVGSALTEKGFDRDNTFMLVEINKDDIFFETISRAARVVDTGIVPAPRGHQLHIDAVTRHGQSSPATSTTMRRRGHRSSRRVRRARAESEWAPVLHRD